MTSAPAGAPPLVELGGPRRDEGEHRELLSRVFAWARGYLCQPHAELGRTGPVCPYVHGSLERGLFLATICEGGAGPALEERVLACGEWFHARMGDGPHAHYRTIVILIPGVADDEGSRRVEEVQRRFRSHFVSRGMMLGEFHPGPPEKPGLWNPDFRPLRSPVPLLAIRRMVPADFRFLRGDRACIAHFLDILGHELAPPLRAEVARAAREVGLVFGPR